MFRENLQQMIDGVEGSLAGILMGFDGISVDAYTRKDVTTDIQVVGMELAHVISQVRRAAEMLSGGGLTEVILRAEKLTVIAHVLNAEYFVAGAYQPDANFGKARYYVRRAAPRIQSEL
jgi:predicted regulator of Ras-like GTPase activity (Roadblock/LC7/MglB family)